MLVLDDYHVIEPRESSDGMAFLLDHLPPQLHLVIASRADPPLPLARLRARGELVEIRAADLRFTADEAAAYLNGAMGLQLTAPDVAALEARTEGWIAALQLAALSMQGRDDAAGFIAGLRRRRPLHRRLPGRGGAAAPARAGPRVPAADLHPRPAERAAVRRRHRPGRRQGDAGGARPGNLFLVPLDDRRQWYRYHHLFADVLRARLLEEQPDGRAELHRRASDWYGENGERVEAIEPRAGRRRLRARGGPGGAGDARPREGPAGGDAAALAREAAREVVRRRPVLSIGYVGALLSTGQFEGVERHLRNAERWLEAPADEQHESEHGRRRRRGVPPSARPGWPSTGPAWRWRSGDPAATMAHAQRALDLLDEDDNLGHGAAAALIGLASWTGGDLEAAPTRTPSAWRACSAPGTSPTSSGCSITLADIQVTQGRLREAMRTYEQALQLAPGRAGRCCAERPTCTSG